jgi:hypothetical protein
MTTLNVQLGGISTLRGLLNHAAVFQSDDSHLEYSPENPQPQFGLTKLTVGYSDMLDSLAAQSLGKTYASPAPQFTLRATLRMPRHNDWVRETVDAFAGPDLFLEGTSRGLDSSYMACINYTKMGRMCHDDTPVFDLMYRPPKALPEDEDLMTVQDVAVVQSMVFYDMIGVPSQALKKKPDDFAVSLDAHTRTLCWATRALRDWLYFTGDLEASPGTDCVDLRVQLESKQTTRMEALDKLVQQYTPADLCTWSLEASSLRELVAIRNGVESVPSRREWRN